MSPLTPLQYLKIDDFSAGIWKAGLAITGTSASFRPAPIGAARADRTFGCISLPGKGLGPLPSSTIPGGGSNTITNPTLPSDSVRAGTRVQITGLELFGNVIAQVGQSLYLTPEIHIGFNWVNNTNHERFRWYRYNMSSPGNGWIQAVDKTEVGYVGDPFFGIQRPYMFSTALTYTTTGFPQPVIAGSWMGGGFGGGLGSLLPTNYYRWWLPDPTGAGAPPQEIASVNYISNGFLYAHQSRVLCFRTSPVNHILATTINMHNNEIDYTDPPLTTTMGAQGTILSAEVAEGFGAIGSVSSGELFLVKKRGGAIIMYDDIVYPRVVRLPGVVSTGLLSQRGSFCAAGMVYAVEGSGIYAWDGSSSSKNISPQLEPNFFMPESPVPSFQAPCGTLTFDTFVSHTPWMNWVVVRDWVYNPTDGSWWRLELLPATKSDDKAWFAAIGPLLFSCAQFYPTGQAIRIFDARRPCQNYQWSSHGIPVSQGKKVGIREVEIEFTAGGTSTVVAVNIYNDAQVATSLSFTPTTITRPWRETIKLPTPIYAEHIQVEIQCDSHDADVGAPIIHSISVGFTEDRSAVSPWT